MSLPNAGHAEIDIRKLRDYVLNPSHANGKHKAVMWKSALGITAVDAEELRQVVLAAVVENDAVPDKYGQRYTVDFSLKWNGKSAIIRTGWIIEHGTNVPRLTTAYPR